MQNEHGRTFTAIDSVLTCSRSAARSESTAGCFWSGDLARSSITVM